MVVVGSLQSVRRLAVTKQRLAGKLPRRVTAKEILSVVRDLGYVQWDPVSIVAPSHVISLWSRLGNFRLSDLERLLWEEKRLFEHWTPVASLVLTEDYALFHSLMSRYPESLTRSWGSQRTQVKRFLAAHTELRQKILGTLRDGPRTVGQFEEHRREKRAEGGWSTGSLVSEMLFHLLMQGEVMVVGHEGNENIWGRASDFLPEWTETAVPTEEEFEYRAAERAILALGSGSPPEIHYYFVRGRYHNLPRALHKLENDGRIHRLQVPELGPRDERYIHATDVERLEAMDSPTWQPRMSLLPPFDNMVGSTARTRRLFDFDYVREQFLPREKRRFGTYVLPILWGERFIGRVDPRMDRASGTLVINSVHAEPHAPAGKEVGAEIARTVSRFASFLGADEVHYTSRVPDRWKSALR